MRSQQHGLTQSRLTAIGLALYGERWQTPLAADLHVADRTMRRWLAGESPIPDGIEGKLRRLLVERVKKIGGMIGHSVDRTPGRDAAREAAQRIRQMRRGVTLGSIKPKDLINEGRL